MTPRGESTSAYGTPILKLKSDSQSTRYRILFLADFHWDHPRCDRAKLRKVLDKAVEEGAWIALLGDTLCAMQGTGDKRGNRESVRSEHQRDDYFTALIETAVEWFWPYRDNIWLVLDGNHETAVTKHHDVDLVKHFVNELDGGRGRIQRPGYQSYAMLRFTRGRHQTTAPLWLTHGYGGGAPVTKGTIQAQRRAVTYPDAYVSVSGHIHGSYFVPHPQHRILRSGKTVDARQEHYSCSGWKDEHAPKKGWHVERGGGPVFSSGWWSEWWLSSSESASVRWSFWEEKGW